MSSRRRGRFKRAPVLFTCVRCGSTTATVVKRKKKVRNVALLTLCDGCQKDAA